MTLQRASTALTSLGRVGQNPSLLAYIPLGLLGLLKQAATSGAKLFLQNPREECEVSVKDPLCAPIL